MKITDLLSVKGIEINPEVSDKSGAIDKLVDLMEKAGNLNDREEYKKAILAREEICTTGIHCLLNLLCIQCLQSKQHILKLSTHFFSSLFLVFSIKFFLETTI